MTSSYGIDVPISLSNPNPAPLNPYNQYLLTNTEIRFDSILESVELYSALSGSITLEVLF